MSSGSSRHSPLSHRRRDQRSPPRRRCDFGTDHIEYSEYEHQRERVNQHLHALGQKEEELLLVHNEQAQLQLKIENLQSRIKELEQDVDKKQEEIDNCHEDIDKLALQVNAAEDKIPNLETQLVEFKNKHRESTAQLATLGRSKRKWEEETTGQKTEIKRLLTETQELRNRKTLLEAEVNEWKTRLAPPPQEETSALRARIQELEKEKADLAPIVALHPKLEGLPPARIAKELVDIITYNLNDVWSYLPRKEEEALVTPATQDIERIFSRLRDAISEDSQHLLKPKIAQLSEQLEDSQTRVKFLEGQLLVERLGRQKSDALRHQIEDQKAKIDEYRNDLIDIRDLLRKAIPELKGIDISAAALQPHLDKFVTLARADDIRKIVNAAGLKTPAKREAFPAFFRKIAEESIKLAENHKKLHEFILSLIPKP